ncbi:hypothetical protein GCM10009090_14410 [[Pseudomonas] boreopolis]|uniref:Uncharacterized protein n=1 Tax=Xanthomonas boreopolis TaxID=86183 RepID=A0A919F6U9_9XANT|nr:hypothetical protein GCM10009090_14410 [[Pseudomonas] boreopolis]
MGQRGDAVDGHVAVAMHLQAEALGDVLGGIGRSIHAGILPCAVMAVMLRLPGGQAKPCSLSEQVAIITLEKSPL